MRKWRIDSKIFSYSGEAHPKVFLLFAVTIELAKEKKRRCDNSRGKEAPEGDNPGIPRYE